MSSHLDGLHHHPPQVRPRTRLRRPSGRLFLVTVCLLVAGSLLGFLSFRVQPIFAALPGTFGDQMSLTRLLRPGRYLILFQNPRELRASGGFLGSFAEVEVGWGLTIKKIRVETNIYTRDQQYAARLNVDPPEPLRQFLADQPWAMRDSNWALDFPEAAQLIAWFYQQEGGQPVDGVIATNARFLERLLKLTGPIHLPKIDQSLESLTVIDLLQDEIERSYWERAGSKSENQPKGILADALPLIVDRLATVAPTELVAVVNEAFATKELIIYSTDKKVALVTSRLNWDGAVTQTEGDYLALSEANLTPVDALVRAVGAKSSWSINQEIVVSRAPVNEDQILVHTLTLTRQHEGRPIWPDGPNHSFLRIAVPQGATLLSVKRDGNDITGEIRLSQEAHKTVFGLWSRLNPGQAETLEVHYQTSPNLDPTWVIQRQPGAPGYQLKVLDSDRLRWSGPLARDIQL